MNSIVPVIESKIPKFIRKEYPVATQLILDSYTFLEQSGNSLDVLDSLITDMEINTNNSIFEQLILNDIGFNLNAIGNIDKRLVVMTLKDFYLSRGSINSFKYIYRLIFNTDVTITYPRNRWFSLSDANNTDNYYIMTTYNIMSDARYSDLFDNSFLDIMITGLTTNASVVVNSIIPVFLNKQNYLKIGINKSIKKFSPRETLKLEYNNKQFQETIYEITIPNIYDPGILYQKNEIIVLNNHYITGNIIIDEVTTGSVDSIYITTPGTGYSIGDIIVSSIGNGFHAYVSSIDNSGGINGIRILNNGNNYTKLPTLTIVSTSGQNGILSPKTNSIGKIKSIRINEPYFNRDSSFNISTDCYVKTENGIGAVFTMNDKQLNNCLVEIKNHSAYCSEMLLHDSDRVNQYSYEIRSVLPFERTEHLIKEHCHEAGTIGFNIVDIIEEITVTSNFDDTLNNIGIY
jgi:hypothetical protein